jgi:hypothetical protein
MATVAKISPAQRARLQVLADVGDVRSRIFRVRTFDALERMGFARWVENGETFAVGIERPATAVFYKYEITPAGREALR